MKQIVYVIALLCCLQTAKADNGVWQLTIAIELKNGTTVNGYIDVPEFEISKDSLKNTRHLIKHLSKFSDSIRLYGNRLQYNYKALCDAGNTYCYTFVNEVAVKKSVIKKITVNKLQEWSYYQSIESRHTLADTAWFSTKPLKKATFKTEFYRIGWFFHEYNPALEKLTAQMTKAAAANNDALMDNIAEKIRKYKVIIIWDATCP